MTLVKDAFRVHNRHRANGDLGVEIEVEGDNLPEPQDYWRCEYDGSLRGESKEYVLRKPYTLASTRLALEHLDKCYIDNNTVVHESVRAGVHVHVNVQELTTVELFTFMVAYIILEDLLIKYCGEYREGNLFCLRLKDAEHLLYVIEQVAETRDYTQFQSEMLRYSSMNVCSLWKFGSLEFRAMRGTRDLELVGDWAEILLNIRNQAIKYANAKELVEDIHTNGSESFLEVFLGTFKEQLCNGLPVEEYVTDGLLRASELALGS